MAIVRPYCSQGFLQRFCFADRVFVKQVMDLFVGCQEPQPVCQLKTLMGDIVAFPYPAAAYCRLVDDLHGYARLDIRIGAVGETFDQVPVAKAQVLGNQKPKPNYCPAYFF